MRLSDWLVSLRRGRRRSNISSFVTRRSRIARYFEALEERTLLSAVGNTLATAQTLPVAAGMPQQVTASIGDEPESLVDSDLFRIDLTAGQQLAADVDSQYLDMGGSLSSLNSFLRIFDSNGTLLASNDEGRDPEMGAVNHDSFLMFTAATTGSYYLGVSSAANQGYDPVTGSSAATTTGASSESGDYQLTVCVASSGSTVIPAVTGIGLTNDTGIAGDGITGDPRVTFTVAYGNSGTLPLSWFQYDLNSDGMSDGAATYEAGSSPLVLNLNNGNVSAGSVDLRVRPVVYDSILDDTVYGNWSTFSFTYAPPLPTVPSLTSTVVMGQSTTLNLLANVIPGQPGDSVSLSSVGQPQYGSIYLYGDTVYYSPYFDYSGTDTFNFTVYESNGASVTSTVTITITAPLPPQVTNLQLQTNIGTTENPITTNGIVAGNVATSGVAGPMGPTLQFDYDGNGTVDATTSANWDGTFAYNVGQGSPNGVNYGAVTLSVRAVDYSGMTPLYGDWQTLTFTYQSPPLPTVPAVTSTIAMGQPASLDLLANVTPAQPGDSISLSSVGQPQHGSIYQYGNTVYYTPYPGYAGADSFSFTVFESNGAYVTSSVTITVTAPLPPQVADLQLQNNLGSAEEPVTTNGIVAGSVSNLGMMLGSTAVQFDYNSDDAVDATTYANWDGTFAYNVGQGSPNGVSYGAVTLRARAVDYSGMTPLYGDWQTLTFTYQSPPLPTVPMVTSTVTMGQSATLNLLANVTPAQPGDSVSLSSVGQPQHGSIYQYGNTVYYTPYPGYSGADSFTFTVFESNGAYVTSSVTITVTAPSAPQVTNLHLQTNLGPTENPITTNGIVAGSVTNLGMMSGSTAVQFDYNSDAAVDATTYANWDGTFAYNVGQGSPNGVGYGAVTLRARAVDYSGMTPLYGDWQTLAFTYQSPPLPTVPAVTSTVSMGQSATLNLLANVTPAQPGDSVSLSSVGQPQHGSIYQYGNTVYYTPYPGYSGGDSFTFTVFESNGAYVTSSVTITVTAPLPPQVSNLHLQNNLGTTEEPVTTNGIVAGTLTNLGMMPGSTSVQFDYNGDGTVDATTYANWDGTFSYNVGQGSPNGVSYGAVTLRARGVDFSGMAPLYGDWQTLAFTYQSPPLPTVPAVTATVVMNQQVGLSLLANVTPGQSGDSVSLSSVGQPQHGSIYQYGNTVYYTPYSGYAGADSFTFTVFESNGAYVTSTVSLTVTAPLPPQVSNLHLQNNVGTSEDPLTNNGMIAGTVTRESGPVGSLPVQYDIDGNGIADGTVYTDPSGAFAADLSTFLFNNGPATLRVRVGDWDPMSMATSYGAWSEFQFTYVAAVPELSGIGLTNDTGTPGDSITSDPRISGVLSLAGGSASNLTVEYDINSDGVADGSTTSDTTGHFTVVLRSLNLADDDYSVSLRAVRYTNAGMNAHYSSWTQGTTFTFTASAATEPGGETPPGGDPGGPGDPPPPPPSNPQTYIVHAGESAYIPDPVKPAIVRNYSPDTDGPYAPIGDITVSINSSGVVQISPVAGTSFYVEVTSDVNWSSDSNIGLLVLKSGGSIGVSPIDGNLRLYAGQNGSIGDIKGHNILAVALGGSIGSVRATGNVYGVVAGKNIGAVEVDGWAYSISEIIPAPFNPDGDLPSVPDTLIVHGDVGYLSGAYKDVTIDGSILGGFFTHADNVTIAGNAGSLGFLASVDQVTVNGSVQSIAFRELCQLAQVDGTVGYIYSTTPTIQEEYDFSFSATFAPDPAKWGSLSITRSAEPGNQFKSGSIAKVYLTEDFSGQIVSTGEIGPINADGKIEDAVITAASDITSVRTTNASINATIVSQQGSIGSVVSATTLLGVITAESDIGYVSSAGIMTATIESKSGKIQSVSSGGTLTGSIKAATSIGAVSSSSEIDAEIVATSSSIGAVTAQAKIKKSITAGTTIGDVRSNLGSISGSITAGGSIATIWAKIDIDPSTISSGGSIGPITSDTGVIDSEITAAVNLDDVKAPHGYIEGKLTAGGNIKDIWAGGDIGSTINATSGNINSIFAGRDGGGNITGNITAGRTIGLVDVTGVVTGTPLDLMALMGLVSSINLQDIILGNATLPAFAMPTLPTVEKGKISGNIDAGHNIGGVNADGSILGKVHATGMVTTVNSGGTISGKIDSDAGSVSVSAWGQVTGDITALGTITVNAIGKIGNKISSIAGGALVATYDSINSQVKALTGIREWALDTVEGTFESLTGNAQITGIQKMLAGGSAQDVLLASAMLVSPASALIVSVDLAVTAAEYVSSQPITIGQDAYVYALRDSLCYITARNVSVTAWGNFTCEISATGTVTIDVRGNVDADSVKSSGGDVSVHANNIKGTFKTIGASWNVNVAAWGTFTGNVDSGKNATVSVYDDITAHFKTTFGPLSSTRKTKGSVTA